MTHRIDGAGAGNANYVQQQNNNVIQDQNNNHELGQARKSGSKLGLAVKIVATILTGGLFGIGWGIYSLVHRASKSQNTAPLNQNNTGVPGERQNNNDIISTPKKNVVKNSDDAAEIKNYEFLPPKEDSAYKFFSTGLKIDNPKGFFDKTEFINNWQSIFLPDDLHTLDKKDSYLNGVKGTEVEKPVAKLINGFMKFAGTEKVNQLITMYLTDEEKSNVDLNSISDNVRKALLMRSISLGILDNGNSSDYISSFLNYNNNKNFFEVLELTLNSMLYYLEDNYDGDKKADLLHALENERFIDEEPNVIQNNENNEVIEEEQDDIIQNNADKKSVDSSKLDYKNYEQMIELFIKDSKYLGNIVYYAGVETYSAVMNKSIKDTFVSIKNQGKNAVEQVRHLLNDNKYKATNFLTSVMNDVDKVYDAVLGSLDYKDTPIVATLKSFGYDGGNRKEESFLILLITKALENPKNAEYFAEDSDKELHVIEFLKMLNDEVDGILEEGRKQLEKDPYYVSGKPQVDDEEDN